MISVLNKINTLKALTFIILALITIVPVNYVGLFIPSGPELLKNNDFQEDFRYWHIWGDENSVNLEEDRTVKFDSPDRRSGINLVQIIRNTGDYRFLRVSADIKNEGVVPGKKAWHTARLILASYDADGRWIIAPHVVASLKGSNPYKHYSKVFKIPENTEKIHVNAQMLYSSGTMWVKNLSLTEAVDKPVYFYWKAIIWIWALFLIWLLLPLIADCRGLLMKGLVTLTVTAILLGALTPGALKRQLEYGSVEIFHEITGKTPSALKSELDSEKPGTKSRVIEQRLILTSKAGHYLLFTLLACSLAFAASRKKRWWFFWAVLMLAGSTELMQYFIEGRTPLIKDWQIDAYGAVSGMIIFYLAGKAVKLVRGNAKE